MRSSRFPPFLSFARRVVLPAIILFCTGCTSTLNRAITREKPEKIDQFLAAGVDVNERDGNGASPLINAAQFGDSALIKKLVERGSQVNAFDHEGNSALSYLAGGEHCKNDAVELLLAHGADVNRLNRENRTPLLLAAARHCEPAEAEKQTVLIALLLGAGANADVTTPAGELPLHLAARAGQPDQALDQLYHATKDPRALDHNGYSAFTEAARGDRRAAEVFLAGLGFEPQQIPPSVVAPKLPGFPVIDLSLPLDARAHDGFGDYLRAHGNPADALTNYRAGNASYDAAIAEYQRAVDQCVAALQQAKDARRTKWEQTIALNVLGTGLAVATGVGFVAVPKTVKSHVDDYEDELARDQAELKVLLGEQAAMAARIAALENPGDAGPKPAEPAPPPAKVGEAR